MIYIFRINSELILTSGPEAEEAEIGSERRI
jgi:hypothetical protein